MYKITFLIFVNISFAFIASAQKANTDSLSLVAKIAADQLKLGKLENTVEQKTNNKQNSASKAQNAAYDNTAAAQKLGDDPQNKKLAKDAKNKASDAKSEAKQARKEGSRLDDLQKEIADLKSKIAGEQSRLSNYTHLGTPASAMAPMPAPSDTTKQQ